MMGLSSEGTPLLLRECFAEPRAGVRPEPGIAAEAPPERDRNAQNAEGRGSARQLHRRPPAGHSCRAAVSGIARLLPHKGLAAFPCTSLRVQLSTACDVADAGDELGLAAKL